MVDSPYLGNEGRLADVIAAIQALGTYKFYKLDFEGWADRISADKRSAEHWKGVFVDHPEFFRLDTERKKASLVWRRQHHKRYDVDNDEEISREEFEKLDKKGKSRISRTPLSSGEIATLIRTAMELHSRSFERQKDSRWWVAGATGLIGVVLGALIRAWV